MDHNWGGAVKAVEYAYTKKKAVLEIFFQTNKERRWLEFSNVGNTPLPDEIEASLAQCAQRAIEKIGKKKEKNAKK